MSTPRNRSTDDPVDFVGGSAPDEDVLTGAGPPRWVWLAAALAVVALVVGGVVAHHNATRHAPAAAAAPPAPVLVPATTLPAARPAPNARPQAGPLSPLAVAVTPAGSWVLQDGALELVDGTTVRRSVRLSGVDLAEPGSSPQLAVDPAMRRIWLVVENGRGSRMIEFDAATLRRLRDVSWPQSIGDAAAYAGHLYVSTDRGVADLAPASRQPRLIGGLSGAVGPIAADPTRHRLVMLDLGYPTDAWTYRPGRLPAEATGTLAFGKGTLAIVDGAIWVGGFGTAGAVLERLDPTTLRPIARSPLERQLGPGAVIVAGGSRVLWVRSGTGGDALLCASGDRGRVEQRLDLSGVVGSDSSGALVATAGGVIAPLLDGCRG